MRAIILGGGKGTRLHPYTVAFPKPLMPLDDMPILEIVLRQLRGHGVDHATLAVGHLAELLMAFLGNGERVGIRVDYSREDEPLGTAGPVKRLEKELPETFFVLNGDLLTTLDFTALHQSHRKAGNALTIACQERQVQVDFGVLETEEGGRVRDYHEKPALNYRVSMGAYVFDKSTLDLIPDNQYFDFPDLIRKLLAENRPVGTFHHSGAWLDIGRPDDYEAAQKLFLERRSDFLPEPENHR